jgi:glucose-6-phosphate 1-epimerase
VIKGETDHVYNPPSGKIVVDVTIGVGNENIMKLKVDGKDEPVSCIIWNPYIEKAKGMSDFGDDQYNELICVELSILGRLTLEGGRFAELSQVLEML